MTEQEILLLSAQIQHELNAMMQHFTLALNSLDRLERSRHDSAETAIMRRALIQLQDSYLSSTTLRSMIIKESAIVRQLLIQHRTSRDAYAQGWADRLSDLLLRLSREDEELRREVERIIYKGDT